MIKEIERLVYKQLNMYERTENLARLFSDAQGKSIVNSMWTLFENIFDEMKSFKLNDKSLVVKFKHVDNGLLISFDGNPACVASKCSQKEYEKILNKVYGEKL